MIKRLLIIFMLTGILSLSCEESLPPFVVNEPNFTMDMEVWTYGGLILKYGKPEKIPFVFTILNNADEVMEDWFFFSGFFECYVNGMEEPLYITFIEERENTWVEMLPHKNYIFSYGWNQKFDNGVDLWTFLEGPGSLRMTVRGYLQIFKKYGTLEIVPYQFGVLYEP